jgi:hypothetical protein
VNAQLEFDLEAAPADVEDQRALDRVGEGPAGVLAPRRPTLDYVRTRMAAVLQAAREPDEPFAYRQALVDLGAVCAELAATMERPHIPARRSS